MINERTIEIMEGIDEWDFDAFEFFITQLFEADKDILKHIKDENPFLFEVLNTRLQHHNFIKIISS